ncbi:PREDICTED: DNA repair protein REV1-like [Camelina sativa]|uniref:DNA repair protein REV1-like n=1 Tax=Camelina sativa TaxID=90675 RepID=A0ABM1QEU1_CAMSA|nr:PREDICTED: DNA repair protein REV1-like [Camelina sativa]
MKSNKRTNFYNRSVLVYDFVSVLGLYIKALLIVYGACWFLFLDVSDLSDVEPEFLASTIRNEILETTGCSASAGIGGTMLMARLATGVAKPSGQLYISAEKVEEFLDQLPVGTLPGVGSVLKEKLVKQNIQTCGQLRLISKDSLQKDFGVKTGEMLWSYSRGLDLRSVTAVQIYWMDSACMLGGNDQQFKKSIRQRLDKGEKGIKRVHNMTLPDLRH